MSAASDTLVRKGAPAWPRPIALTFACAASLALLLDPYLLNGLSPARVHEGLPLLMLGVSAAFAYGLGFSSENSLVRALLHPALAWGLIGLGLGVMAIA